MNAVALINKVETKQNARIVVSLVEQLNWDISVAKSVDELASLQRIQAKYIRELKTLINKF